MTYVHINRPRAWEEFKRETDEVRWCFKCRSRLQHDMVLAGEPGISYYSPQWSRECSGCKEDHSVFPGTAARFFTEDE